MVRVRLMLRLMVISDCDVTFNMSTGVNTKLKTVR